MPTPPPIALQNHRLVESLLKAHQEGIKKESAPSLFREGSDGEGLNQVFFATREIQV